FPTRTLFRSGYQINSLRRFITENPFMAHTMDSLLITNTNHYYGGIKGNIQGVSYNLQGGFRQQDDLPIFQIQSPVDPLEDHFLLYEPVFYEVGIASCSVRC